jgi:predicted S18 family serine protease
LPPVVSAEDRKFTGTVPSTGSLNTSLRLALIASCSQAGVDERSLSRGCRRPS